MISHHGRREGDHIVVPYSQREIAKRCGVSPSTICWYLDALGEEVVIARRPYLILSVEGRYGGTTQVRPTGEEPNLTRVVDALADVQRALGVLTQVLSACAGDSNFRADELNENASRSRFRSNFLEVEEGKEGENLLPSSPYLSLPPSGPARGFAGHVGRSPSRTDGELDDLIAPLVAEVLRLGLTPVGNRRRLATVLAPFSAEEVASAIGRLVGELRGGARLRSPFGLLIRRIETGDVSILQPSASALPVPPAAPAFHEDDDIEPVDELTAIAEMGVAEMESDPLGFAEQLAELDVAVEARLDAMPASTAKHLRTYGPMRRAFRVDAYRSMLAQDATGEVGS